MTELEKIAYAKTFMDKLANGINPLDDKPLDDNDVINNVRLSRCFFFVSDILRQVIENGGTTPPKKNSKSPFSITQDQLSNFSYSETPLPISQIVNLINELVDTEKMKKLSYKVITSWLISINALEEKINEKGKAQKFPTENGNRLGISVETRHGMYGDYQVVIYNKEAQAFILDNLEAIIS